MKKKPVALIDLDGTLADFHAAMARDMAKLLSPEDRATFAIEEYDGIPHLKERADLIKHQPGWWLNLEPIAQGFRVLDMLVDLDYKLHICTRASINNPRCWMEKVQWVNRYMVSYKHKMTITQDKALMRGAVLMDDWPSYVEPWLKASSNGLVILPNRSWNQNLDHARVLRHSETPYKDGTRDDNDYEVYEKLKAWREKPTG